MVDRFPIIPGAEPWSSVGKGERGRIGIVTVHGFTGNPVSMRPLAEGLAERGFAVEVPRLPGHGTRVEDMVRTCFADWRGEVERALKRLHARTERCVLVGLSMGGTLVLDVASGGADVAGVVAINAPFLKRRAIENLLAPYLAKFLPVVPGYFAGLAKNDAAKPGVDEKAYRFVPTAAGNSLVAELPRIQMQLASFRKPVLIAYSLKDHSVPPDNSRAILRTLPGPDVTELRLERSYHLAPLDYDQELLIEKICDFADRVAAPLPSAETRRSASKNP
jgi:carboxylesterase